MIIGITGTLGAGKGTAADYLSAHHGFAHLSVRAFLQEEIARRGMSFNRDSMVIVANGLRAAHGPDYITQELLRRAKESGGNVVIESIRSLGEASYLKQEGAQIWAIDADIAERYERIVKRGLNETDHISFEKFKADEEREMGNDDPTKQNIAAVMKMADHVFYNAGTADELHAQIDRALSRQP